MFKSFTLLVAAGTMSMLLIGSAASVPLAQGKTPIIQDSDITLFATTAVVECVTAIVGGAVSPNATPFVPVVAVVQGGVGAMAVDAAFAINHSR
jgi:hypothetical protein